jgi:hypothetical protein
MVSTLVATVNCNRGAVTTLYRLPVTVTAFVVQNASQGVNQVQYWGTLFEELIDPAQLGYPYQVIQTRTLYRRATQVVCTGTISSVVNDFKIWIPRNYRLPFATITLYRF